MLTVHSGVVEHVFDAPGVSVEGMNDTYMHFNATTVDVFCPALPGGSAWLEWCDNSAFTGTIHGSAALSQDSGFGGANPWFWMNVAGFSPSSHWFFRAGQGDYSSYSEVYPTALSGNGTSR